MNKLLNIPTAGRGGGRDTTRSLMAVCGEKVERARFLCSYFMVACSLPQRGADGHIPPLPLQVWQCGGSVEVLPCSRIAHIERAHKPYTEDLTAHVRRNALRVAEVWMDEFKSHVYMAWNIPQEVGSLNGATLQVW